MKNILVAQSGGPTAVINSSAAGVIKKAMECENIDKIYGGINGIEGILENKIIDLTDITKDKLNIFRYTPSSGLGSCRYKMKHFSIDDEDYIKFFKILDKYKIQVFFYIGGNDSMDTVYMLSEYAKNKNIDKQILGIPKTIDNDLVITDHTPGYGSAAKFIATTVMETYLDSSVYKNNGIFILETMGRDTGWLAASAVLAKIDGNYAADFIYLPEAVFNENKFIEDIAKRFNEKGKVYIVASEGIKDSNEKYVATLNSNAQHDKFGHAQLGGVCGCLKSLIINNNITKRVKTLELGVLQRCAMHCVSKTDIDEAFMVGQMAVKYSYEGISGSMVAIRRIDNNPYTSDTIIVNASKVANKIKHFPSEWINTENNNINKVAIDYIKPLINGTSEIFFNDGLPVYGSFKK